MQIPISARPLAPVNSIPDLWLIDSTSRFRWNRSGSGIDASRAFARFRRACREPFASCHRHVTFDARDGGKDLGGGELIFQLSLTNKRKRKVIRSLIDIWSEEKITTNIRGSLLNDDVFVKFRQRLAHDLPRDFPFSYNRDEGRTMNAQFLQIVDRCHIITRVTMSCEITTSRDRGNEASSIDRRLSLFPSSPRASEYRSFTECLTRWHAIYRATRLSKQSMQLKIVVWDAGLISAEDTSGLKSDSNRGTWLRWIE